MNQFQIFALNHFLSDYPDGVSYTDVLRMVEERSDDVVVWEPFERYPPEDVAEFIDALADSLKNNFIPRR